MENSTSSDSDRLGFELRVAVAVTAATVTASTVAASGSHETEEVRWKRNESEIISEAVERGRPNADALVLYEKLSALSLSLSRFSRPFSISMLSATLFIPACLCIRAGLFSFLFHLFFAIAAAEAPVFPLLPRPRSMISRVPTKFSRAAIPDRLYNYPVLSSSSERTSCSREAARSRAAEEAI